jgi:putative NIF3 family GTP cyclohydrolase 1 type 2
VDRAIAAMRKAHSYEEPAFDVYPLRPGRETAGEGRVGTLATPLALGELARLVRAELKSGPIQMVGDPQAPVERVALACGAAGEYLKDAIRVRANVFLSGEMRFHDYLSAQANQIGLLLPGHYATERFAIEALAFQLAQNFAKVAVSASLIERDPVLWV